MDEKKHRSILKIMSIYIILQPFFDILSNLYIDKHISIPISTYVKPIFVFSICTYLFFKYSHDKVKWFIYACVFIILIAGHTILLHNIGTPNDTILNELRVMINIVYMLSLYIIYKILYVNCNDKKGMLVYLKKTVLCTFFIYSLLFLIAVLTKTGGMTYEYADLDKKGFKGWFDSGQILGHSISIMFPIMFYLAMKPRNKWYIRVLLIFPIILTSMLIGTRVPYIIVLASLVIYLIISIFCMFVIRYHKTNIFNLIFTVILVIVMVSLYKFTPLHYNVQFNIDNLKKDISEYNMEEIDGSINIIHVDEAISSSKGNLKDLKNYKKMCIVSTNYLRDSYYSNKVHPSDTRNRQYYYSKYKYIHSKLEYKLFGIGYMNQDNLLAIESDFYMAIFSFGILGFICFLLLPVLEFIKSTIYLLKNIKYNDLEIYLLYLGIGVFFSISIFAGYSYMYTNFSINLVLLITLLKLKMSISESMKKKAKPKDIAFLLLHTGYGGIESATINTANELVKKYNVTFISFYKLKNNQVGEINKKIKIKYLYNGGPNRNEFKDAVRSKNIFKILKEGIKSVEILIKKELLIIKEIRKYNGDALISTRMEFNILLSKYGKESYNKVALEHCHHNNDKKYINNIKKKYYNIDYLFALTSSLKSDYEKFLEGNNSHTKVIHVPNMLTKTDTAISDLKNKNIISVGRLHTGKRIDELIKIFSKLNTKSSKLYIIGDGDEYINLSRLIDELNLSNRVYLLGYKNHDEINKYYQDSCIFAMTSITEGLPMVLLEAGSAGIPSIAYQTDSGVEDIIDNGINGFVIKNRNEEEYIAKLDEYLKDKNLQKTMSKNMLEKTKEFSAKKIINIWVGVLEYKYEENNI